MNAVECIRERLEPRKILEHYGFKDVKESHDAFRACCAIHGGDNPTSFIWNKQNNLWYCYTGEDCGGGDVFTLVEKMENISFHLAIIKTAKILEINIDGMEVGLNADRLQREQKQWLERQRKRRDRKSQTQSEYSLPYTRYYELEDILPYFNRFSVSSFKNFNAAFCSLFPTENSMLKKKLVIPIIQNNLCLGVALRDTTGSFGAKWMYQPNGLKTSNILYNLDKARRMVEEEGCEEIILVEGIFDVWAYYEIRVRNVCAIFGSSLSSEQMKALLRLNVKITFSFDADEAGRRCAEDAARRLKNKADTANITLPCGKDPADCTEEELMTAYLNRR